MAKATQPLPVHQEPDLHTETMILNYGPSHPSTHGTIHLELELDGETVIRCRPHIGYLHSGFEKLGEHLTYNQWIPLSDRMNYLSPLANNIGFAVAVEKLLDIEITPRAQAVRVILAELSRIADHLVCTGMQAVDIGAFTAFLYGFGDREKIYNIFELVTGTRLTTGFTRVGGMMRDVPDDFIPAVKDFLETFPETWKQIDGLLTRNKIWVERTQGIGVLSAEDALDAGFTGPNLRASGVPYDIRADEPYCGYENYDFEIPIGEYGDVYDRWRVRMEEMVQSCHIIRQIIDKGLPAGPINADVPKVVLPDKSELFSKMESLIHQFKLIMPGHGFEMPKGEVYSATESPNGELGFYLVSDGSNMAYRLRVRPPSFVHLSGLPRMLEGHMISDIVAILGSINIIAGELDR
ncbi:MAG: NADH dehydrogenase (quinone) subunit D [Gemmatimonadetes bacterium]|nr:MAG: NADH dehydrogenase (quinone) subunit D [Gemmatimonadota bacterium]